MSTAFAIDYWVGDQVERVRINRNGDIWFGFESQPPACTGDHYTWHAEIRAEIPGYDAILSLLLFARASGMKVDIWFNDMGDCTSESTLLDVESIGIPATP